MREYLNHLTADMVPTIPEVLAALTASDTRPQTAGDLLLAALTRREITPEREPLSYLIPLDRDAPADAPLDGPHLCVADRNPDVDHAPADHTGWIVSVHDANGEPLGDLYSTAGDHTVDCAEDSEKAAEAIQVLLLDYEFTPLAKRPAMLRDAIRDAA
ncbi:hypothetical protein [Streptomyces pseudogriseolus]|uniref:hypothetical protein n=1 Tax=Streptomyces pseudogriseolus TaxID=36817 RepID=UPI000A3B7095